MKKILNIILLCLMALTASAQSTDTHRLRVSVLPTDIFVFNLAVYYSDDTSNQDPFAGNRIISQKSDTIDIDVQVPAGAGIKLWISTKNANDINAFQLVDWKANGAVTDVFTKDNEVRWIMPDYDVDLVGTYEYNPENPGEGEQPNLGSWDPETGTLIIEGNREQNPLGFTNADNEKVLRYIRIYNSTDKGPRAGFNPTRYPNCKYVDYSRTNITRFSCSISNNNYADVTECVLPATITSIESNDFRHTRLQTLTLYALTPPQNGNYTYNPATEKNDLWSLAFSDSPDLVVRVPAEALPLYKADNHWNIYTLLPMDGNFVNLSVQLMDSPVATTLAQYKDMSLLLTNKTSGQTRRYILNGHDNSYEFRYLPTNSTYKIQLLNSHDEEVAMLDNVFMGEEDRTVTFDRLRRPHQLVLNVSDGQSIIDPTLYDVTWFKGLGEYLKKGNTLDDVLDNEQVSYLLHLRYELAMKYQTPDSALIIVGAPGQTDNITVTLQPIPLTKVTFTVVDSLTHRGIEGATIVVAQRLEYGEAGSTVTLTTDADGKAQGEALAMLSRVTVTSPSHGSQEFNADLAKNTDFRTTFIPANGTTIRIAHTWQRAIVEGEPPSMEPNYEGLNHEFTAILPDGSEMALTEYIKNFPIYALYSKLPTGTRIHAKVSGANGEIEPVEGEATVVEDDIVSINLPIVQRGWLQVQYNRSDSRRPALLLFDNTTGELLKKQDFGDYMSVSIKNLAAGKYFVAAMNNGPAFQTINSKSQLLQFKEDKDYVCQEVTLRNGQVSKVLFDRVPLSMTQLESNLTSRRAQWKQPELFYGYSANISIAVQFNGLKERVYRSDWNTYYDHSQYPTDCKIEVYLPEDMSKPTASRSCRMYSSNDYTWQTGSGTFTQGGNIDNLLSTPANLFHIDDSSIQWTEANSSWDVAKRKLTVEWPHIDEGGKMYITTTPKKIGTYTPEVYLTYTLNGKQYREVLETNTLTVQMCDINVPELVVSPRFRVSGNAEYTGESIIRKSLSSSAGADAYRVIPYEGITIMDGNQPIGKASVNSSGTWEAWVTLPNTYPLFKHNIYARIKPYKNKDFTYDTEAKEVVYDPNAVVPLSTKMTFFNHHPAHLENCEVVFDYVNGKCTPSSFGYDNHESLSTDFTFEVNLSNNDTTKVYACAVFIATQGPDAEERVVMAHYNKRKNRWVAYSKFNTRTLPYSVMVEPYYHSEAIASREAINEVVKSIENVFAPTDDNGEVATTFDEMMQQVKNAIDADDMDLAPSWEAIQQASNQLFSYDGLDDVVVNDSIEDYEEILEQSEQLNEEMTPLSGLFADGGIKLNEMGTMVDGISTSTTEGISAEALLADGYKRVLLDDGSTVYLLQEEGGDWSFVDFKNNIKLDLKTENIASARGAKGIDPVWKVYYDQILKLTDDFNNWMGRLSDGVSSAIDFFDNLINKHLDIMKKQQKMMKWLGQYKEKWAYQRWWETAEAYKDTRKEMARLSRVKGWLTKFKVGDGLCSIVTFMTIMRNAGKFALQFFEILYLYTDVLPWDCPDDQADCDDIRSTLNIFAGLAGTYYVGTLTSDIGTLVLTVASIVGLMPSAGLSFLGIALTIAKNILSICLGESFDKQFKENMNDIRYAVRYLECDKRKTCQKRGDCPKCVSLGTCPEWPKKPKEPKYPTTNPLIDPSGFVYEGVESNRLADVTTTVFHKRTQKNSYGMEEEIVYLWDAENYEQQNPQQTDENGKYGWMVPAGMWQVKYEKPGYQTEYSEWLPVPPPQLDVNQGMRQMSKPVVSDVKATPQAVLVSFDKYMRADSLTTNRIFVTRDGKKVSGSIDLMLPADDAEALKRITNRVRFVPATPLPAGQKLMLTVKGDVTSYAGIEMGSDFQQEFDIKAIVESIVADSAVNVIYDQGYTLTIQAQPVAAAAGKKVTARVLSNMIASANATELTLDSQGRADITITGEAHGTTALLLQMADDPDVKQVVIITVREQGDFVCPMPTSDYQSSQAYPAGTQITLTCTLPEATIWYTLDGTCPCDPKAEVHKYEHPITLTNDVVIQAFATAPNWADSDIAELSFMVGSPDGINIVTDSQPVRSSGTYTLSGVKVGDDDLRLHRGLYIRNGRKIIVQ